MGFLSKTRDLFKSAVAASYVNGWVGDQLLKRKKGYCFIASDIVEDLEKLNLAAKKSVSFSKKESSKKKVVTKPVKKKVAKKKVTKKKTVKKVAKKKPVKKKTLKKKTAKKVIKKKVVKKKKRK